MAQLSPADCMDPPVTMINNPAVSPPTYDLNPSNPISANTSDINENTRSTPTDTVDDRNVGSGIISTQQSENDNTLNAFNSNTEIPPTRLQLLINRLVAVILLICARLCAIPNAVLRTVTNTLRYVCDHPFLAVVKIYKAFRVTLRVLTTAELLMKAQSLLEMIDDSIKRHVAKREERGLKHAVLLLLELSIFFDMLYAFMFAYDGELRRYALCELTNSEVNGIKRLFRLNDWDGEQYRQMMYTTRVALCNDYLLKLGTMLLKCLVLAVPVRALDFSKREDAYRLIEYTSQLFRILLPIRPWLILLTDGFMCRSHSSQIYSLLFIEFYLYYKLAVGTKKILRKWWFAVKSFLDWKTEDSTDVSGGGATLDSDENECPICYEKITTPKRLTCSHVYCKRCIERWFRTRENGKKTCPLCTAPVDDGENEYCDGATARWEVVL